MGKYYHLPPIYGMSTLDDIQREIKSVSYEESCLHVDLHNQGLGYQEIANNPKIKEYKERLDELYEHEKIVRSWLIKQGKIEREASDARYDAEKRLQDKLFGMKKLQKYFFYRSKPYKKFKQLNDMIYKTAEKRKKGITDEQMMSEYDNLFNEERTR